MSDEAKYVLVYVGREDELYFMVMKSPCGGRECCSDDINKALVMTLDDARRTKVVMKCPHDWEVWSVRPGICLELPDEVKQ